MAVVVKHKARALQHMDFLVARWNLVFASVHPLAKFMDRRELAKAWPCDCQLNSSGES